MSNGAPRSARAWCIGLFLLALVLRLVHLITVLDSPLFRHLFIDPATYDAWGQRIASGQLLSEAPFFLDPLYPYVLGAIYATFGHELVAVALVQVVIGALVPPLVFLASRRWFEEPVPAAAGILSAIYAPSIFWTTVLMKPCLAQFAFAATLVLISRAMIGGAVGTWLLAGATFAAAGLLRASLLLVLPVVALFVLLSPTAMGARGRTGGRRRGAAGLLAGALLVLAVPATHNAVVGREFILTTTNWGQIFFIGNHAGNPAGEFFQLPFVDPKPQFEQRDFKAEAERRAGRPLDHTETSRFWFGQGWAWARQHPGDWAAVMWRKLRTYWGAYETPASLDYYVYKKYAPVLRWPLPGFAVVAPFGLVGAGLAWRRRGWPRLLVLVVVAHTLAVVTFFVLTRFRVATLPALHVLAAVGAVDLLARCRAAWRGQGFRPLALPAAALLACGAFVNLPVRATADSTAYRLARLLHLPTRLEHSANAHFNLGVTYAALAKDEADPRALLEVAESELRESLRQQERAKTHVELGKVLARLGRDEEAIAAYRAAMALDPADPRNHHALGLLLRRQGDLASAAAAFREALARFPGHAASAIQLGQVLLAQGQAAEAAAAFRHALRLAPENPEARAGLDAAEGH